MSHSDIDQYYLKKQIPELIEKMLVHRITGTAMDPKWYDALILHFDKRDLTEEQKNRITYILNTDIDILKSERYSAQIEKSQVSPDLQLYFPFASFSSRFLAWLIDYALLLGLGLIVWAIFNLPIPEDAKGPVLGGWYIFRDWYFTIFCWLYFSILESEFKQATLGKMALGIKVTDLNGNSVSFGRASIRFWGKFISGILLGIGYLMMFSSRRKQTLHDQIAKCLVIKK